MIKEPVFWGLGLKPVKEIADCASGGWKYSLLVGYYEVVSSANLLGRSS